MLCRMSWNRRSETPQAAQTIKSVFLVFQQREEFRARSRVVFESSEQTRSFHDRILLLHTAHHHTEMFGLYDHGDPGGFETSHERPSNLRREIFLDLQSAREDIDDARHLGKADHFPVWNVSHVRPADEWKQMMFAHRIKLDVLDENDLARFRLEDGIINNLVQVLPIPLGEELQSTRRPIRRASQTFSIQIFADALKQVAIRLRDSVEV